MARKLADAVSGQETRLSAGHQRDHLGPRGQAQAVPAGSSGGGRSHIEGHASGQGDSVVIPPGVVHAYGAAPSCDVDVLVLFTPGVPLHDFLRCFIGLVNGERSPDDLAGLIPQCDVHRDQSAAWAAARSDAGPTG